MTVQVEFSTGQFDSIQCEDCQIMETCLVLKKAKSQSKVLSDMELLYIPLYNVKRFGFDSIVEPAVSRSNTYIG